jgi:hypothetical protein
MRGCCSAFFFFFNILLIQEYSYVAKVGVANMGGKLKENVCAFNESNSMFFKECMTYIIEREIKGIITRVHG